MCEYFCLRDGGEREIEGEGDREEEGQAIFYLFLTHRQSLWTTFTAVLPTPFGHVKTAKEGTLIPCVFAVLAAGHLWVLSRSPCVSFH